MQNIVITNIRKKNKFSQEIVFENEDSFILNNDLVFKYKLSVGLIVKVSTYEDIITEQITIEAKQIAYKYATYKNRFEKEVRTKLVGYPEDIILGSIQFLKQNNILNDEITTEFYIKEKIKLKLWGSIRLKNELQNKGVNNLVIFDKLNQLLPKELELENGIKLFQKKYKNGLTKDLYKKSKAEKFLAYNGYSYEIIRMILDASQNPQD
jgi:SOS response regulatory protein OraA/RecX